MYVSDAEELFEAVHDPASNKTAMSLDDVQARIRQWESRQSPDRDELWLNWTLRLKGDGTAIGRLQATVKEDSAEIAWVVGRPYQGRGYASEAGGCVARWLLKYLDLGEVRANIHPDNIASQRVATKIGLSRNRDITNEGDEVWTFSRCRVADN